MLYKSFKVLSILFLCASANIFPMHGPGNNRNLGNNSNADNNRNLGSNRNNSGEGNERLRAPENTSSSRLQAASQPSRAAQAETLRGATTAQKVATVCQIRANSGSSSSASSVRPASNSTSSHTPTAASRPAPQCSTTYTPSSSSTDNQTSLSYTSSNMVNTWFTGNAVANSSAPQPTQASAPLRRTTGDTRPAVIRKPTCPSYVTATSNSVKPSLPLTVGAISTCSQPAPAAAHPSSAPQPQPGVKAYTVSCSSVDGSKCSTNTLSASDLLTLAGLQQGTHEVVHHDSATGTTIVEKIIKSPLGNMIRKKLQLSGPVWSHDMGIKSPKIEISTTIIPAQQPEKEVDKTPEPASSSAVPPQTTPEQPSGATEAQQPALQQQLTEEQKEAQAAFKGAGEKGRVPTQHFIEIAQEVQQGQQDLNNLMAGKFGNETVGVQVSLLAPLRFVKNCYDCLTYDPVEKCERTYAQEKARIDDLIQGKCELEASPYQLAASQERYKNILGALNNKKAYLHQYRGALSSAWSDVSKTECKSMQRKYNEIGSLLDKMEGKQPSADCFLPKNAKPGEFIVGVTNLNASQQEQHLKVQQPPQQNTGPVVQKEIPHTEIAPSSTKPEQPKQDIQQNTSHAQTAPNASPEPVKTSTTGLAAYKKRINEALQKINKSQAAKKKTNHSQGTQKTGHKSQKIQTGDGRVLRLVETRQPAKSPSIQPPCKYDESTTQECHATYFLPVATASTPVRQVPSSSPQLSKNRQKTPEELEVEEEEKVQKQRTAPACSRLQTNMLQEGTSLLCCALPPHVMRHLALAKALFVPLLIPIDNTYQCILSPNQIGFMGNIFNLYNVAFIDSLAQRTSRDLPHEPAPQDNFRTIAGLNDGTIHCMGTGTAAIILNHEIAPFEGIVSSEPAPSGHSQSNTSTPNTATENSFDMPTSHETLLIIGADAGKALENVSIDQALDILQENSKSPDPTLLDDILWASSESIRKGIRHGLSVKCFIENQINLMIFALKSQQIAFCLEDPSYLAMIKQQYGANWAEAYDKKIRELVEPIAFGIGAQIETFKKLPRREQMVCVGSIIVEQFVQNKALGLLGKLAKGGAAIARDADVLAVMPVIIEKVRGGRGRLCDALRDCEPIPVAMTPEGIPLSTQAAEDITLLSEMPKEIPQGAPCTEIPAAIVELDNVTKSLSQAESEKIMSEIANLSEFNDAEQRISQLNKGTVHTKRGFTVPSNFNEHQKIIEQADKMYDQFRASTTDVQQIAKNTGISETFIKEVKNHLFSNEQALDSGFMKFDADIDIAKAWQRLIDHKFEQADLKLLLHEYVEQKACVLFKFHTGNFLFYRAAHNFANQIHNWESFL